MVFIRCIRLRNMLGLNGLLTVFERCSINTIQQHISATMIKIFKKCCFSLTQDADIDVSRSLARHGKHDTLAVRNKLCIIIVFIVDNIAGMLSNSWHKRNDGYWMAYKELKLSSKNDKFHCFHSYDFLLWDILRKVLRETENNVYQSCDQKDLT